MADIVLILREPSGLVKFDSRLAVGGVCLGIFTIPPGGTVFTFENTGPNLQGTSINPTGEGVPAAGYSYDNTAGYPRFTFTALAAGLTVALFVK